MKLLKEKIIGLILIPLTLVLGCAGGDAGLENIQQRGYSDSSRLVSTEWLSSHLNDKNLVVVDLRKKEDYDAGHIPGALHLTPGEVFQQTINEVKGMLPTLTHIEKHLGSIGLTPESVIVLYDGKANLWASRGLWALDVYGHKNTKLLDGVWTKWSAENRATVLYFCARKHLKPITLLKPIDLLFHHTVQLPTLELIQLNLNVFQYELE
jgi:thiosulfate/3-mercaptopyruvate sulfurtransferase